MNLRLPVSPSGPLRCNSAIKKTREKIKENIIVSIIKIANLLNKTNIANIKNIPDPRVVIAPLIILVPISLNDTYTFSNFPSKAMDST